MREEGSYGEQRGGVVGVDLAGNLGGQLIVRGVGEVKCTLYAGVENNRGQCGVLLGDAGQRSLHISC